MKSNTKWNKRLAICLAASALLGSCAEFETRDFFADRPQSLIDQEERDAYNELKTYANYDGQPHFKLGVELSLADLASNNVFYRLMQQHFDEVSLTTDLRHVNAVQDDGSVVLNDNVSAALETHANTEMSTHLGHLVWHENQASDYLNTLIADIIIPGESGTEMLLNFEEDELNDSYPVLGAGSTTVTNDPDGVSGKVLHVLGPQTFPQFEVDLPEGLTLGHCKSVTIDFKGAGCCGLYGAGMRMAISTSVGSVSLINYNSPSGYGAPDNVWFRNGIILPIADLNLSNAQKELTSFVLTIGSATGGADYLIDNISIQWEKIGETIIKTPEEKAEIFTNELDKWIAVIGTAGKDKVNSWSVVYQPMDEENPSELRSGIGVAELPANTFYWQDYLGKDYASIAIGMIKQYANANDRIFFTETNLVDNPAKIQGLVDLIAYTEDKGAPVDGIVAELSVNVGDNKEKIESALQQLAETGKLIKISFDIGTGTTINQATTALYQQQAEMYKWFVETYYQIIPADQRAGITFRSPADRPNNATWRPNQPVGLWTNSGGYQRKPAYVGIVEALERQ